jgi:drug/metabolite transporter (DMT)-like permease
MNFFRKLPDNYQGICYIILACLFASILISLVRHLCGQFHIFFIVMMRNFFGLLFFAPQIIKDYKSVLKTNKPHLHFFRGLNGLVSTLIWFHVVAILPLSEAVSISFLTPILTTIVAIIFLKEKFKLSTLIGGLIGFIGILIILRPGFKEFNPAYFYAFASVISWTFSNLTIKAMTKTEKPKTIAVYMSFMILIFSIPLALPHLQTISLENFLFFTALGIVSNLTVIFTAKSYAKAELSVLQPFDFMRLIFIAIISYFAFGEVIDFWVALGSLVILFGVLIVLPKRRNKKLAIIIPNPT